MNVLMVTPTYLPRIGGIEYHIKELASFLRDRGHSVSICAVNSFFNSARKFLNGEMVYYVKAKGRYPFISFERLDKYFEIEKFDIIHVHDPHLAGLSLHFVLNHYSKPKVLSTHGGFFHTRRGKFLKLLYWNTISRLLIRQYSKVVCVSHADYLRFRGITNNAVLIENGINIDKFSCGKNFVFDRKSFIYFGRLSLNKRIDNLLKLFDILIRTDKEIKLTLVGEAEELCLKKMIESFSKKYPNNFKVLNFLNEKELKDVLCKHSFFITATEYEGFGISILEAVASGRIAVINRISPLTEIFTENEVFFVDFSDIKTTAKKIMKILTLPESYLSLMRMKAMIKVRKYDWRNVVLKFENLYREVLDG